MYAYSKLFHLKDEDVDCIHCLNGGRQGGDTGMKGRKERKKWF
jgi:hypothetical protein